MPKYGVVILTGSRDWEDPLPVDLLLRGLRSRYQRLIVIHGDNPNGLDAMCEELCRLLAVRTKPFPANWDAYGPAAGHIRNETMLRWALRRPQHFRGTYGFHEDIDSLTPRGNKRGTKHMLDITSREKKPAYLTTTKF